MRTSKYLLATTKETPSDTVLISHQLMLKAGLIRKLSSGLYSWMPLGLRVLNKISRIIREEMDASGALEVLMPIVQPATLWKESGRWDQMGPELQRLKDRHDRDFCLGPTHEEVITDLIRNEVSSYKQLPLNLYQIQTKFRDERRPRYGVMRAREFTMKDAYSFHVDQTSLQHTYELMYQTYSKIFTRLGFTFRVVEADSGSIGGNSSHEFHVLADSGEDEIVFSSESKYAANIGMASSLKPTEKRPTPTQDKTLVNTPNTSSIEDVCTLLKVQAEQTVKTLIVLGEANNKEQNQPPLVALVLRGDHQLNEVKATKIAGIQSPLTFANEKQIIALLTCKPGFIGPVNMPENINIIVDRDAAIIGDFVCGANQDEHHLTGVNWGRDCNIGEIRDLRNIVEGDFSPDSLGTLSIKRGIEVGHIFQLGNKYSKEMGLSILNENGKNFVPEMGCYGIGVTRIVAAAIEQCHDDKGIIWANNIAPFHIALIPLNAHKSQEVSQLANKLYRDLTKAGVEVLYDDRDNKTNPGVKFSDMDLIGIPHRLVISERSLKQNKLEYKHRTDTNSQDIPLETALEFLSNTALRKI